VPSRLLASCAAAFAGGAPLLAQSAFRVADIGPGASGSGQHAFACAGGLLYFDASDGVHGFEPWRSDGTAAGTYALADVHPAGSSSPHGWTPLGAQMVFVAFDPTIGEELWRSDGTPAGTSLLVDLQNGFVGGPYALATVGDVLFFAGYGAGSGFELWRSDGTASGTSQVAEIFAGSTGSLPDHLTDLEGTLMFSARDDDSGERELWRSDGSAGGTLLVKAFDGVGAPQDLRAVGSLLFFTARTPSTGRELWRSDGTSAGTWLVLDVSPGAGSSNPSELVALDGLLYFTAWEPTRGRELWRSDGTRAGTFPVLDVFPGDDSSEPHDLTALGSELLFAATDPVAGQELWASDGTGAGTRRVRDIAPGTPSGLGAGFAFTYLTRSAGLVYFAADDLVHGTELWRSDGREGGTYLVQDVQPGPGGALAHLQAEGAGACDPWLFFLADDGASGLELWATDALLCDDFEAGGLERWSEVVDPGGTLAVTPSAALEGQLGLALHLDGTFAPRYLEDRSPAEAGRYRARFLLDASGLVRTGGAVLPNASAGAPVTTRVRLLAARDGGAGPAVASLELVLSGAGSALVARARDDGGAVLESSPVPLSAGPHAVEIDWLRASADGVPDGHLELFVDGAFAASVPGLDSDGLRVRAVRFGALAVGPGVRGTLAADGFESRRVRAIGL